MKIPYIPEDAPFSGEQKAWLAGFLAGLHSRASVVGAQAGVAVEAQPAQSQATPLTIVYGTQTGNAEMVANDAAEMAKSAGYAPIVQELDALDVAKLPDLQNLIVVISTYGEGEMPDNAGLFWDALSAPSAPRLEGLKFGVIALGDEAYEHFCQAGKLIDTRLEQLGATRLSPRIDCDIDYEDPAEEWLKTTLPMLSDGGAVTVETPSPAKSEWSRKNPYTAQVVENRRLSGPKSAKEIRHIAFDLGDSGLSYETGDALGVMPVNSPGLVAAMLERVGANHDTLVDGQNAPLGALLTDGLEIMTPSRDLIAAIEKRAGHDELTHVVSHGDKEALDTFMWGRDTLDLLNLNPSLKISPAELVSWLKPLQHRAYSISSSPKAHNGEVHLTVAAVRWMFDGREHRGVCSTFLADDALQGAKAQIFMSPNKNFRVPENDDAPMIMVGPGTGIAPFRAFLEERRARGAGGKNWLFFGDQHRESDFIYDDEIGGFTRDGVLNRLDLAFSRDQESKIYVQTRMRENGQALYAWLEDGGYFYVCGDATRMARDVDEALHSIISEQGGVSPEDAAEYVNTLKREKRYLRDVY